jgi:hypothetical protein
VYTDFKTLKVKVPINFSGTQGFPACRDGRYTSTFIGRSVTEWLKRDNTIILF